MNVAQVVRLMASLAWLAAIAVIATSVMRAGRGQPIRKSGTVVLAIVGIAILLTVVAAGLVFIQPEERGVVISALAPKGYREETLQPGLRWVVPFFENVVLYPISRQSYTMSIAPLEGAVQGDDSVTARTSDGQELFIDASVIFAIDPNEVIGVHIDWKNRYVDELIRPQARGIIRDTASQYGVEEIVTSRRDDFQSSMETALTEKMQENGLVLIDFILRNITFSPEYAASVEQKQIAEQLAQQAELIVQQRKQEAEQARQTAQGRADALVIDAEGKAKSNLIEAEAQSKALELIGAALRSNPALLNYEYIQRLAPGIQVMLVPSDNPYLLPLPTLAPAATIPPATGQ
ncbi:MAG: prohibitin family protein [Anaerolineales bacterium]|nr:prohibitin family protein [Anaerolineales bacterium]